MTHAGLELVIEAHRASIDLLHADDAAAALRLEAGELSEPLTRDVSTWIEVPEYSAIYVSGEQGFDAARIVELAA